MKFKYYQVDAFTDKVFKGNPAGVIFSDIDDKKLMQKIAFENNLSETAFVAKINNEYYIRWFAPLCEVDLCGHATLASAFIFFNYIDKNASEFCVSSKSGILIVRRDNNKYYLDFPLDILNTYEDFNFIELALGHRPQELFQGRDDILAIFKNESVIKDMTPDFNLLSSISNRGVIASAKSHDVDFVSRCFFPSTGVKEDPVTGSAHTTLLPYWSSRLDKKDMIAKQISQRGGLLYCSVDNKRAIIGGEAILFLTGEIEIKS